ncbi:MAG: flippase-like domain-containing protein [Bifidobacteriaceae bacterium]|jgi:uncharacterized membrane protein YbhN (UPF0104 family)|nr:flippase-like domain-containing protein [Bifidobacteriaceae bacterium]
MLKRLGAVVRSPVTRWAFLAAAIGLAIWGVAASWDQVTQAWARLSPLALAGAAVVSVASACFMGLAWRAVLTDLGSRLPLGVATSVFGLSQLGKYLPGGVWNVVAAAELGADHRIPRWRSVGAMALAVSVSLATGVAAGALAIVQTGPSRLGAWSWALLAGPLALGLMAPPVLNRLVTWALRIVHAPGIERGVSWRGLGVAAGWSCAGWAAAGLGVWLLATGMGLEATAGTLSLSVGAYALAWVVGFLVVVAPAGVGAREGVLLALFSGVMPAGQVLVVVLMSRILLTAADLLLAGLGGWLAARRRRGVARSA